MANTTDRGYGTPHQAERARWAPTVEAGQATCARCHEPIAPTEPWDLGHTDDRQTWHGPEHRACNRSAGGRNGATVTNTKRQMTIRDW
jgi:hypothetical protein